MDLGLERTRDLIQAARAGQREAYEELFRAHRADLAREIANKMRARRSSRCERSDIVQQTLLDAVAHFDTFEPRGPGSFRRWLVRILENRLYMSVRRERREKRDARRDVQLENESVAGSRREATSGSTASPSFGAARREERERVRAALERLPAEHARVIRLVKLEELSIAVAAQRMSRSENAVKKLLARALLALRAELGESGAQR
jgi:RNA polymerase sigma-70 factor (ECF subfamily)